MEQIRLYGMAAAGSLVLAAVLIALTLLQLRVASRGKAGAGNDA
jgi:alpha-1,4-digalacturonate transport system permease protein